MNTTHEYCQSFIPRVHPTIDKYSQSSISQHEMCIFLQWLHSWFLHKWKERRFSDINSRSEIFLTTECSKDETEEVWTNIAILASFPGLPFFVLWFALNTIHRSRRVAKEGKAREKLPYEYIRWMQGGHWGKVPHSRFLVDFIAGHSTARHGGT